MKKAEIIKNGNVNLTSIDKAKVYIDFCNWLTSYELKEKRPPTPTNCFNWLFDRLS